MPSGTARYNGMGGSFGALGADPSVMAFNPAGLGVYKSKQFSFTPSFKIVNTESSYLDSKYRDYDANYFDLNNLSFVQAIERKNDNIGMPYFVWGVSYNKLNKYDENISIGGTNPTSSLTDWFASRANGINYTNLSNEDPYYSHLAWETYLIDPADASGSRYVTAYDKYGENQSHRISKVGGHSEYNVAIAFNFIHKVFVGFDLGFQTVNYKQTIVTSEDRPGVTSGVKSFEFTDMVRTTGSGVNFKAGILYSPIEKIRFGASIQTPTSLKLKDRYSTSCVTNMIDSTMSCESPEGAYEYNVLTPFRANASFCYIPVENFSFNIDYDLASYKSIKMRSSDYDFAQETQNIIDNYGVGHCVKLGAEYRLGFLSFRLGGAFYSSPYNKKSVNKNYNTLLGSAGIGMNFNHFNFDVAYSYTGNSLVYYMYEGYVTSDASKISYNRHQVIFTLGFRW
ncbi:MAG: outer membrane protein transport protein, partial [Bacteroidales bacterium]|nr:outer membrane protein transport protein [Bacteroidales bacterium]